VAKKAGVLHDFAAFVQLQVWIAENQLVSVAGLVTEK
jgi:hypothetical protein